ncbi:MAG: GNAT family N-acetyltransferase [Planctomycetota bacterium]|nr:GNAT family N-acetyltransferase [Planctomycetota bacterium]
MTDQTSFLIRRMQPADAETLAAFYNGLSKASIRTFRPLGTKTAADVCLKLALNNGVEKDIRFDLLALTGPRVVGWCFLWDLDTDKPMFGLGIADDHHGQGLGGTLMDRVMQTARDRRLAQVFLTVVKDNVVAWRLYEKRGFVRYDEYISKDDGETYLRMACGLRGGEPAEQAASVKRGG